MINKNSSIEQKEKGIKGMNLNREEVTQKIVELNEKAQALGAKINLKPNRIHSNRQHCYWYNGLIGTIEWKQYVILIDAKGDMIGSIYQEEKLIEEFEDRGNDGAAYSCLEDYFDNDDELEAAEYANVIYVKDEPSSAKYRLVVEYVKGIEFCVFDTTTKKYLPLGYQASNIDDCDVVEAFDDIKHYISIIEEYEKNAAA